MQEFSDSGSTSGAEVQAELFYLIERFLSLGPCHRAAQTLRQEIDSHQLLPHRVDFTGRLHRRSFSEYESLHRHLLPQDLLLQLCKRTHSLLDALAPRGTTSVRPSLLGVGRQSLLRSTSIIPVKWTCERFTALRHQEPLLPPTGLKSPPHICRIIKGRELGGRCDSRRLVSDALTWHFEFYSRILGHLSSVFCVAFDRSGRYIFTGADDNLIKVWSAVEGRLLFTFRGFAGEITDLTVNHENTLLAAGSCDKSIRVWCLKTGAPVAILQGHSAVVTSLQFLPYVNGDSRYLVSTGNDCCVCFWKWNVVTNEFDRVPVKFPERLRANGQMICSSHSAGKGITNLIRFACSDTVGFNDALTFLRAVPIADNATVSGGGLFIATGGTDHFVRVYTLKNGFPERIWEVEGHSDRVDSLQWAHRGLRFLTGSKDGNAKIWTFERNDWNTQMLPTVSADQKDGDSGSNAQKAQKVKVTMVAWSLDDSLVVTASSDSALRIWDARTATLMRMLNGHTDEAFVLEPHPFNSKLLISAGHDGNLIVWNLHTGAIVKKHNNAIEGMGHGAFFDCRFSPDGNMVAAVDSHGNLTLLGIGSNEKIKEVPREQFFHTDYRPVLRDSNNYVLDEQTQMAPHLMPPPFLVNSDGDPLSAHFQALVPGRERCNNAALIPHVVTMSSENEHIDIEEPSQGSVKPPAVPVGDNSSLPLCTWATRPLIRRLEPSVYEAGLECRRSLREDESLLYESELNKPPLPAPVISVAPDQLAASGRRRRAAAAATNHKTSPDVSVLANIDPINPSDDDSDDSSYTTSESSAESETSDPDYSDMSGPRTRQRAKRGSDEEQSDKAANEVAETSTKSRRQSPSTIEESALDSQPSTSTAVALNGNERPKRKRKRVQMYSDSDEPQEQVSDKPRKSRTKRLQRVTLKERPQCLSDVPKQYAFPEWITCVIPRKAPYFPQIGDEVVYFPVGHRVYINAVRNLDEYKINEKHLPWNRCDLQDEEFAIIENVRFELEPVRLCCLKMNQINAKTGRLTNFSYTVRYHDIPSVVDFIVLRQHYDTSLKRKWKPGDHFQAVIDDSWWFGTIESKESDGRSKCHFQSLKVLWDNGEEELMSPWDLEPPSNGKCSSKRTTSVATSPEELIQLGSYLPKQSEWPTHGMESEVNRLQRGIEKIIEFSLAEPFAAPVDLNAYPQYCLTIEYPSDLTTIKSRLENKFYRRLSAFKFDVEQLSKNAAQFNERGSQIVKQARVLVEILLRFMSEEQCTDIVSIYNQLIPKLTPGASSVAEEADDDSSSGRRTRRRKYIKDYMANDEVGDDHHDDEDEEDEIKARKSERNSRKRVERRGRIGRQNAAVDKNAWIEECKEVMQTLLMSHDSVPFRGEPNVDGDVDFANTIESGINLSIISKKLSDKAYLDPEQFYEDVKRMLNNSKALTTKRSKIYSMSIRLIAMFQGQMEQVLERWHQMTSVNGKRRDRSPAVARKTGPIPQARPCLKAMNGSIISRRVLSDDEAEASTAHEHNRPVERSTKSNVGRPPIVVPETSTACSTRAASTRAANRRTVNNATSIAKWKASSSESSEEEEADSSESAISSADEMDSGSSSSSGGESRENERPATKRKRVGSDEENDDDAYDLRSEDKRTTAANSRIRTRANGVRQIRYDERSDEEVVVSTSSRGRLRKVRKFNC